MRIIDFSDSQSSASEPNTTNISAGSLNSYANDAAFVSAKETSATTGDIYFNTTLNDIRFYDNTEWHTNESELNNIAAVDPDSDNDSSEGYEIFSTWVNSTDSSVHVCVSAAASSAVWKEVAYQDEFDTTLGHDHDGTDSKKVLGTNIDSTSGSADQLLTANGSGGSSWGTPTLSPSFGTVITSSDTTLSASGDDIIFVDASSADVTLTLPPASNTGTIFRVVKIDSSSTSAIILDGDSTETIDSSQTVAIYGQFNGQQIAPNGTEWFSIKRSKGIQDYYITQAQGSLTNRDSEIEFALGTATITNSGPELIVASDDSGNTRTKFTAAAPCKVSVDFCGQTESNARCFGVGKNGSLKVFGAVGDKTSNGASCGVSATIVLDTGDYITVGNVSPLANPSAFNSNLQNSATVMARLSIIAEAI